MKKIAFLSIYTGIVDRGVETFVYEVSKRLSRKYSVTVFQSKQSTNINRVNRIIIANKVKDPISTKGLFGKLYLDNQSLRILFFTIKCIPILMKEKYEVIIPVNGGWQTVIIRIVTKVLGAKMLTSGHAGIGSDDAWNILVRPDIFVALTSSQKEWATKLTNEVETVMIPNGVDLSKFNPKISPAKVYLKKPIVICASALVPYKRVDLTIRAVAKTKQMSLLVLGKGEMQGQIDSLGKRLLKERYIRISPEYAKMPTYYAAGDIFTLASETEAFGISYLEAMACNLPVVTTSDPARQEIIGNAGILTTPTNINTYANDLILAAKTNYRNIPYDQALKYSWNQVAKKYSILFRQFK